MENQKKKKHLGLMIVGGILLAIIIFMNVINIIPPKKNVANNPFIVGEGELPMIAAHRGGGDNNPENTMLAFREAVNTIGIDIIESDLYLTKDGYLVYNHDSYIDETCNVNGDISLDEVEELCKDKNNRHYISDMTLAEIEQYNFGYYFKDENGERIYKDETDLAGKGLQIATVDKLFAEFYESNPDLLFIVEIKNSGELGYRACEILYNTLKAYPEYMDQIVIGTFHDEIETELKTKYPELLRGAPTGTAAKFVLTTALGVNLFDNSDFACLQIPTSYDLGVTLYLDRAPIIQSAHRRNVAVQYWTINDPDEMRKLIELGCDCIMTDNPKLLKEVLAEYETSTDAE
jgi:glycerophosphoryl diester phosphodiesterase